ncbi:hypothetical protein [Microbacterium sp. CPCC 204701]|uniref:hypothetical protein n=1 Tax=Microbacterium sp. CPCC 204701 TaxID=2493084 RepID=UPI000FDB7ADE|nr:hypothetical protein [Microbacterium sp. CPCC 204701]
MSETTLADDARRLAAIARAKRESETDSQEQRRLQAQIDKLSVELTKLGAALEIHRRLGEIGAPVHNLPDLGSAPRDLRDQINRTGRPTWRHINARVIRLERVNSELAAADTQAWASWADGQISNLATTLIPMLGFDRRNTEARVLTLQKSAGKPPSLAAIDEFQALWRRVRDDLAEIESAGANAVLNRFVQGRIRLSDITDEELELLRADETLRDQLYLSLS